MEREKTFAVSPAAAIKLTFSEEGLKREGESSNLTKSCVLSHSNSSSGDADISAFENERKNADQNSVYSMVSCSDLTPGSLDVWVDLPEEIKYDPLLAPFKLRYEQQHGTFETNEREGDNTIFNKKLSDITAHTDDKAEGNDMREANSNFQNPVNTDEDPATRSAKAEQWGRAIRVVKLSALVGCWALLTVSLLLNKEKSDVVLHTAVTPGQVKEYPLQSLDERVKLLVTLTGPFGPKTNGSINYLHLWLHGMKQTDNGSLEHSSDKWLLYLLPNDLIDFAPSATETKILDLGPYTERRTNGTASGVNETYDYNHEGRKWKENGTKVTLKMSTISNRTVPLTLSYQWNPIDEEHGIVYAVILLCSLYILIIFEVVNRTIAALLSSSLGVAVLALNGARPSLADLVSWLDVETLLLLFSMMILVAILAETGLFDYLAVVAFEVTGGRTWPLINCLCFFTAFFSTFLDNVTTVLLMTPVTIRLCEVMQLNPVPVLMSMVIFSNVGGAATPVGDPPNVIIASHPSVLKENINFTTFTLHMSVGILLVSMQTYLQLRFMFRDINKLRHSIPIDVQEMRHEIAVWRRAADSLSSYSRDEDIVRRALGKKVEKLSTVLKKRKAGGRVSKSDPLFCSTLADMKHKYQIRDKQLLVKSTICVLFVVVVFFLHAIPELQRLSLGWTALLGALLLLLLSERVDLEPVLARVEWSTLLFFAALFVMMEVLAKLGLISWIGKMTESLILKVGEQSRLTVAIMLVIWVSGLASAFVDNIPLTTMMIRVTAALADPEGLGLPLAPLVWALSFGACLGGNGTLIGASANVVCAGVAEQHGYRFTFIEYLKIGFPIMIGNLLVASGYLLLCHCVFQWH